MGEAEAAEAVLEELWGPIAALTAAHDRRANGLITSTAVTASLLPEAPRVSVLLARSSLTHDLVRASGAFALHLLPAKPPSPSLELFRRLGLASGHDGPKLDGVAWRVGTTGAPVLDEALAYVEARVADRLETREITVFVGDVVAGGRLREGTALTIDGVRARLSGADLAAWSARREDELRQARELIAAAAGQGQ
jgi:flavin reductase (DIM6/NTAB) family NADH-FMN oxidoreductase RutF